MEGGSGVSREEEGGGKKKKEEKGRGEIGGKRAGEEVLCDSTQTFLPGFFAPPVRDRQLPTQCTAPAKQHQNCTRLFLELIFCF